MGIDRENLLTCTIEYTPHNPFNHQKKNLKIGWKIKILFLFQIWEISEFGTLLDHFLKYNSKLFFMAHQ